MRFLLDVHIANTIAQALESEGHDVLRAALHHASWSDSSLLALAVEDERIIITEDSDFSDLIYALGMSSPLAIIYIRCEPEVQPVMAARVLDTLASGRLDRHMAVIRASSTRYRPLPGKSIPNE